MEAPSGPNAYDFEPVQPRRNRDCAPQAMAPTENNVVKGLTLGLVPEGTEWLTFRSKIWEER